MANDNELFGLISFLERLLCYDEGSEFEIFTNSQVMEHLSTKTKLERWLQTQGNFNTLQICLKPGKIYVLGDSLSRLPHITKSEDDSSALINSLALERAEITSGYNDD